MKNLGRVRPCDKCGSMANVTRVKAVQTVTCPTCKHRSVKNIVHKGRGG